MKKTRRRRRMPRKKIIKGGGVDPATVIIFFTMLMYGLYSIVIGPAYLLAEALNAPISSINNFSRKSFNHMKQGWLHRPLISLFSEERKIDEKYFLLKEDRHVHQGVAVVSNDSHPDDPTGAKPQLRSEVQDFAPSGKEAIQRVMRILEEKKVLRLTVYRLFQYIENIRATDEDRKLEIREMIDNISDYTALIKCYLIYKSMSPETCRKIRAETKTILKDEDVITIVNPFYNPCDISYTKRIDCLKRHLTQKRFDKRDPEDRACRVSCDTCTFRSSVENLINRYMSSGAWVAALALVVSGLSTVPAIAGITNPAVSSALSGVASSAAASAASFTSPGLQYMASGLYGIGSGLSTLSTTVGGFTAGSTGALVGGIALISMMPYKNSDLVEDMLNVYFKNIVIENKSFIQDLKDLPKQRIPIYRLVDGRLDTMPYQKIDTNILAILDQIKVSSILDDSRVDAEDRDFVLGKFNRFICKYDIIPLVKTRIALLYSKEENRYSIERNLGFILDDSSK